jgi:hypothetical protein
VRRQKKASKKQAVDERVAQLEARAAREQEAAKVQRAV